MNTMMIKQQPQVEAHEIEFWQYFSLEQALLDFEKHLTKQRESTQIAYRRDIREFLLFSGAALEQGEWQPGSFPDRNLIEDYVLQYRMDGKKPRTINRYLAPVRVFLRLLARQRPAATTIYRIDDASLMYQLLQLQRAIDTMRDELVEAAAIEGEKVITPKEGYGVWLSEQECNLILSSIDRSTLKGLRDYAILMVGLWTGLRVSEIQQLTFVSFVRRGADTYAVYTIGKRGKGDPVACDARAYRAVEAYVNAYNAHFEKDDPRRINQPKQDANGKWEQEPTPLWREISKHGCPLGSIKGIGIRAIRNVVNERSKVLRRISPHDMRRSVIKNSLERGMPAHQIKDQARHSSVATTIDIYANTMVQIASMNPGAYGYNVGE